MGHKKTKTWKDYEALSRRQKTCFIISYLAYPAMFRDMRKFKTLSRSKKLWIVGYFIWLIVFAAMIYLGWVGRDFPKESELNYTTGVLQYTRTSGKKHRTTYPILQSLTDPNQKTRYECEYIAFPSITTTDCVPLRRLKPYLGQTATVGWYKQKSFLGVKNYTPQLVTLKVSGKKLMSYKKTTRYLDRRTSRSNMIFNLIQIYVFTLMYAYVMYPSIFINPKQKI